MTSHVIFAGMLDDPYMLWVWLLVPYSIIASLLCLYRYKSGYAIVPISGIISAVFLNHFLAPEHYYPIIHLSDAMPRLVFLTIGSVALPIVAMYLGWRRSRDKRAASA